MTQNKSVYNSKKMNNMMENAKREALEMSKKSTNRPPEPENASKAKPDEKKELPKSQSVLDDLLGNFKLGFNFDEDTLLLAGLIYFLYRQEADSKLLIALLYVLLF